MSKNKVRQLAECKWEYPKYGDMRVPVHFYANTGIKETTGPEVLEQSHNVACLPGVVGSSIIMPDAHWGYGFPIGGVAAFDPEQGGVISVGGIGYDISCGVRTFKTGLKYKNIKSGLHNLADTLFKKIPSGLGSEGVISLTQKKLDQVLLGGAKWAVEKGFGEYEDLEYIEDFGCTPGGDPQKVSKNAKQRQNKQMGTLGSGNHYLEIQYVQEIFDQETATAFGLQEQDVLLSLHCGSRALGHQIGTDYIQTLGRAAQKYGIELPQRDLVCAPINSREGQDFFQAMVCGINCALANREILGHLAREAFAHVFPDCKLTLLYDVSHNTCKIERHYVDNKEKELYVHRKGATRAFGPQRRELPSKYSGVGQPVLIGGTMGTESYILAGCDSGENLAWCSACHGAGRAMSRRQATKRWKGQSVIQSLAHQGVIVKAKSRKGAAEEAPEAYKNVSQVVNATHQAGLARKVAKTRPLACIKG